MKLGFCLKDCKDAAMYEKGAALGYDFLELQLSQIYALTESELRQVKELSDRYKINPETTNMFFTGGIKIMGKDKDLDAAYEYAKIALGKAGVLGVEVAVLGSSWARSIDVGCSFKEAADEFSEYLYVLNDIAANNGIIIAIEPLNKGECNFINTVSEGLEIVRKLNMKNIRLLADYYHMAVEKEDLNILKTAQDYLGHVHFADPEGRILPVVEKTSRYMDFFNILKSIQYNKRCTYEASDMDNIDKAAYMKNFI